MIAAIEQPNIPEYAVMIFNAVVTHSIYIIPSGFIIFTAIFGIRKIRAMYKSAIS